MIATDTITRLIVLAASMGLDLRRASELPSKETRK